MKILKIKELIKLKKLGLIFNFVKYNDKTPMLIKEKYNFLNERDRNYPLRNQDKFKTIRFNTRIGSHHSYSNTEDWNNLPINQKVMNNKNKFLKELKKMYINSY